MSTKKKIVRAFVLVSLMLQSLTVWAAKVELPGRARLTEGVEYKQTSLGAMKLDIYTPDSLSATDSPVLVFIHGGSWMYDDRKEILRSRFQKQFLDHLLREGYAVVSIEYRLASATNGVRYPEPLADCKDAIRWIRKECATYHFDPARIAVAGTSAGGHLALMTSYTPDSMGGGDVSLKDYSARVTCCVDFYGPTGLVKMLRPSLNPLLVGLASLAMKPMVKMRKTLLNSFTGYSSSHPWKRRKVCNYYSPLQYADTAVPTIVFHGNKDKMVPYQQTTRLRKAVEKNGQVVEVHTLDGKDHSFPGITAAQVGALCDAASAFLRKHNVAR